MMALRQRIYAVPILVAVLALVLLNAAFDHAFVSFNNWASILAAATPFMLTAMAQTAPVLAGNGGIDLSVGPLAGLTNAVLVAVRHDRAAAVCVGQRRAGQEHLPRHRPHRGLDRRRDRLAAPAAQPGGHRGPQLGRGHGVGFHLAERSCPACRAACASLR